MPQRAAQNLRCIIFAPYLQELCVVISLSDFDLAGSVARLFIYPVKSRTGIKVQQALLTDTGLKWDRAWMAVDVQSEFLTQRALPRMALVPS